MAHRDPERAREYQAAWYKKNREKRLREQKEYYEENYESIRKEQKEYKAANRDRLRKEQKEYKAANRERLKASRRRYKALNRDKVTAQERKYCATRRARRLDQFIEEVDPATVYQMHGGRCGICEEFIEGDFHVDHVIPLSKGGMHGYINVQPAHPSCNLRKGAKYEPKPG